MQKRLGKNKIVLLGVGHTNAHVLKMWRMAPIRNCQLICISNFPQVTYSGMLPGVLSGQYHQEQMEIDLVRLCSVSGARLIIDDVQSVDRVNRQIHFAGRAPLSYDALSIGIGSVPSVHEVEIAESAPLLRIKPMQTFLSRLNSGLQTIANKGKSKVQLAIVGAGIGGTEIAFCLDRRLKQEWPNLNAQIHLINGSEQLVGGCLPSTESKVRRHLQKAGIEIHTGNRVRSIEENQLRFSDGRQLEVDLVLWATSATAAPLLNQIDVSKDDRGFLLTRETLQTLDDERIFAVGDTGTLEKNPTLKAGVFAVRQGPILWKNLDRLIQGKPLEPFQPQKSFLKLINLGDGRAVAEWMGRSFVGNWCWRWKNHIDLKFMRMYQNYEASMMSDRDDDEPQMRCVGCGGKVSGASLESALAEIDFQGNEQVVVGVEHPDDAAIVRVPDEEVTVTTDFFASPVDDPFLFGQISALNGSSDNYAMGAQPFAALTMAQVPFGHPKAQREVLVEMMAGAAKEFNRMKTSIVGGHSIEGPRMAMGFTVMANQVTEPLLKSNLSEGDQLIVSKALGTGTLLAALMEGKCRGNWFQAMKTSMLRCNSIALEVAKRFSIRSMTDVTGFGLAGHLHELLVASQLSATLRLAKVPILKGFSELTDQGIESTMNLENRSVESSIQVDEESRKKAAYAALFDPQTCGGLLIAAAPNHSENLCQFLRDAGFEASAIVGEIIGSKEAVRIRVE